MIKILLADDSLLVRAVLRDALSAMADMVIVGEATNGADAVSMAANLKPDLIIMDIIMPVMGGLEATEAIMARCPAPILILSATLDEKDVKLAFTAIKKGALDVMGKPTSVNHGNHEFIDRLVEKIRLLARIRVIHHMNRPRARQSLPIRIEGGNRSILAIGASTGGPKAVMSIVRTLPADFKAKVFIVQHISSGFARGFSQWLNMECALPVRLAESGDLPKSGEILVAPNDCQMIMEGDHLQLLDSPPVNSCKPSIDVFFASLAEAKGSQTVGVLLTGMGKDGAQGLALLRESGSATIVQDEKSCAVFGMPKAAIALNAADEILPLPEIPAAITRIFSH
ncbi:MAG TPA: chemotaxis-specific protein-glutamate methyltransferase CheB [Geobacteraceae bacterium]|nr:chemotaxis-specific protein-glutamate methyltransferase CheB [Geobacteraceae bacterium]